MNARYPSPQGTSPNRLLASLPLDDYQRLLPALDTIRLPHKQVLKRRGDSQPWVFFPGGGVCSVVQVMEDGKAVEVITVGKEGFIGIAAIFGASEALGEVMVQVAVPNGTAQVMAVATFQQEMGRRSAFFDTINRYARGHLAFLAQSVACNALHSVEQRCARWLLTTHDRVDRTAFRLTHEFLAVMLGVRRPSVTVAAAGLQRAGLIDYSRQSIIVLDRAGLEAVSCECYGSIQAQFTRLRL